MGPNHHGRSKEEVITCPTKTVVRTRTTERVRKFIHPTEIINVHKTVIRNEHHYPVYEREVNETVEKGSPGCGKRDRERPRHSWI